MHNFITHNFIHFTVLLMLIENKQQPKASAKRLDIKADHQMFQHEPSQNMIDWQATC
jgi:hypothetical protein